MIEDAVFYATSSPSGHLGLFGVDSDWVREVDNSQNCSGESKPASVQSHASFNWPPRRHKWPSITYSMMYKPLKLPNSFYREADRPCALPTLLRFVQLTWLCPWFR